MKLEKKLFNFENIKNEKILEDIVLNETKNIFFLTCRLEKLVENLN
jgi:hypothetical protein